MTIVNNVKENKMKCAPFQTSEKFCKTLIETFPDAVAMIDLQSRFVYVSEQTARLLGVKNTKALIGENSLRFIALEDRERVSKNLKQAAKKGIKRGGMYHAVRKDGTCFVVEVSVSPLCDARGKTEDFVLILRDVTERKKAEETLCQSEQRYRNLHELAPYAIVTVDRKGVITSCNAATLSYTGYSEDEIVGKHFSKLPFHRVSDIPKYIKIFNSLIRGKVPKPFEINYNTKDGTSRWVQGYFGLLGVNGSKEGFQIAFEDITERKRTEQELQHATEGAHAIIWHAKITKLEDESQGCAGFSWDTHYLNLESVNEYLPLQKHPSNNLSQMFYFSVLEEDRAPMDLRSSNALKRGADNYTQEFRLIDANGTLHWMYEDVRIKRLSDTQFECIGLITDITERKLAEEEIRASEKRFRTLTEDAPIGIYYNDFKGTFLYGNKKAEEIIGYKSEELIGKNFLKLKLLGPRYMIKAIKVLALNKKGKATGPDEFILNRKDGTQRLVEINTNVITISGKKVVLGMVQDITERKKAEEALRTSEAQLSNAMEIAKLGYWEYDVAEDTFTFNDHFYAIFRTTAEKVGGYKMSSEQYAKQFIHPDDMSVVGIEIRKAIETTDPNFSHQLEHRIIYADGEMGYISVRFFVVKDSQGRTIKTYGANQDITGRKRAEEKLRESEAHYRALAEASHDMVVVADHKGRLTYTNQYAARQLESSPQELAGNKIAEIFPSEIALHQSANLQKVFQSEEALYVEAPSILQDRVVWLGTWLSPIVDERGKTTHVLIVSRDITERKQAEEQIKKDLKEKEILLRELYHRTKNNMQVICAMLRLQASRLEDQKIKELFKEIETKIYSIALVHQKLLGSKDLSYLNLKDYLDTLLIHFKQSYFESLKNISIHTDMEDINILIDTAIPLGLVFNELISNVVKHAFPDSTRGEIKIKLYLSPQNKIVLEVSDNGIGLPKGFKIQKDIHLGLEIVIDLIEYQLDGKIYFKSKDGLHCKIVLTKELYKPRV